MIITQKKPMEELMAMVGDAKTVAIVGCNSCATACHTGGEPEVAALAKALEAAGKKVVGTTIADYCCMNLGVKGKMKPLVAAKPDCVICMSCGDGVQCVAKNAPGIPNGCQGQNCFNRQVYLYLMLSMRPCITSLCSTFILM